MQDQSGATLAATQPFTRDPWREYQGGESTQVRGVGKPTLIPHLGFCATLVEHLTTVLGCGL